MSGGENTKGDEGVVAIILGAILVTLVAVVIWVLFHAQISQGIVWLRQGEMYIASLWVDEDKERLDIPVTKELAEVRQRHNKIDPRKYTDWQEYLPDANTSGFKFMDFSYVSKLALDPFKYIFALIIFALGAHAYFFAPTTKFRRKLDLNGLLEEQSKSFPQISPFVDYNPSEQKARAPGTPVPVDLPPFAEALSPEEWVAYNRIPLPDGKLDREMTKKAFEEQLGKRWQGASKLPKHMQVLLAAFILKAARKRSEADTLLGRIAKCWSPKDGLKLSKDMGLYGDALKILKDKKMAEPTYNAMKYHAFVTTAMLRALDFARSEGGVLAPAQFVWLRGYDRALWYPLNNLGKQSFHPEALGALSHFKNEKRTLRPIPVPKIDDAVETMSGYIESSKSKPIPELDYGDKKEGKKSDKAQGILKPAGSA